MDVGDPALFLLITILQNICLYCNITSTYNYSTIALHTIILYFILFFIILYFLIDLVNICLVLTFGAHSSLSIDFVWGAIQLDN